MGRLINFFCLSLGELIDEPNENLLIAVYANECFLAQNHYLQ